MIREPVDLSNATQKQDSDRTNRGVSEAAGARSTLERFGCVFADEGAKHSKYVNLADPAALRRFQTYSRLPISSHEKFAANSVSQIQSKRIPYR